MKFRRPNIDRDEKYVEVATNFLLRNKISSYIADFEMYILSNVIYILIKKINSFTESFL